MTAPRISHILETSLYVADLDRAASFYQDVLGFVPTLRDARMCALEVPGGGVLLLFRQGGGATPSPTPGGIIPAHDGRGALHLAFGIPWGELAAWEAHFAAKAIAVESRVLWPRGGTSLYVRDPDGHSVEVATPGLWPGW